MTAPASRDRRRADYLNAVYETDDHTASCGACQAGTGCNTGDLLMDNEYRSVEDLRAVDRTAARNAAFPTKEG